MNVLTEYLAAALLIAVLAAAGLGKGWLDEKANFDSYKGAATALGQAAEQHSRDVAVLDKSRKEIADAQHTTDTAALAEFKRVRDQQPHRNFVPAASPAARNPEVACFDRTLLERAISSFTAGVQGLTDRSSQAVIDLNTAKKWAQPEGIQP